MDRDDGNNTLIKAYLASSPDGENLTKNFIASDVRFTGNCDGTTSPSPVNHLIGDTIELATGGDSVYGCWADTCAGTADSPISDIFGDRVRVVPLPMVR